MTASERECPRRDIDGDCGCSRCGVTRRRRVGKLRGENLQRLPTLNGIIVQGFARCNGPRGGIARVKSRLAQSIFSG